MDELVRTLEEYASNADAYVETYRSQSVAALYGNAFFEALTGDRVLDVGCGPGSDLETVAAAGYDVTGLDITPAFLRAARDHVADASLVRGDMRRLPFRTDAFDGVWSSASFLHVPRSDAIETLRAFRRVLGEAGIVFLSVKREATTPGESEDRHFEYYRPNELRALLHDAGLEPRRVRTVDDWISVLAEDAGRR